MAENKLSFELKNKLSELDTLEEKVHGFSGHLGLTEKSNCKINLVLEELFTNIVSYGYSDDSEHEIQFTITHENGNLTIQIEDDGIPFNPADASDPDLECILEERKIGGLGIHLIKKLMDDVLYQRCGEKNVLILKKDISDL